MVLGKKKVTERQLHFVGETRQMSSVFRAVEKRTDAVGDSLKSPSVCFCFHSEKVKSPVDREGIQTGHVDGASHTTVCI